MTVDERGILGINDENRFPKYIILREKEEQRSEEMED